VVAGGVLVGCVFEDWVFEDVEDDVGGDEVVVVVIVVDIVVEEDLGVEVEVEVGVLLEEAEAMCDGVLLPSVKSETMARLEPR
jgi:hypothetical protein